MAVYDVTENLNVQVNVDNLTDDRYVTDYSAWGHFRPNDPRNVRLNIRYTF
jgi:catecholate siderophore receptor